MNKQQLSEALAAVEPSPILDLEKGLKGLPILAAARLVERLLPGECGVCDGKGMVPRNFSDTPCTVCHGWGQVWDEGIVEAVAQIIATADLALRGVKATVTEKDRDTARAVLSALVELLTEKVK